MKNYLRDVHPRRLLVIVLYALLAIVFLSAFSAFLSPWLNHLMGFVQERFGLWGLALFYWLGPLLFLPIPIDFLTSLLLKRVVSVTLLQLVGLGAMAALSGITLFVIGWSLSGESKWRQRFFSPLEKKYATHLYRYGFWAVLLSTFALLPFGPMCLLAGILRFNPRQLLPVMLLRILRVMLGYYLMRWFL